MCYVVCTNTMAKGRVERQTVVERVFQENLDRNSSTVLLFLLLRQYYAAAAARECLRVREIEREGERERDRKTDGQTEGQERQGKAFNCVAQCAGETGRADGGREGGFQTNVSWDTDHRLLLHAADGAMRSVSRSH